MIHHTTADFWDSYEQLPEFIQRVADANDELLRADSRHPSLHFKRVGRLWSVRVGIAGWPRLPLWATGAAQPKEVLIPRGLLRRTSCAFRTLGGVFPMRNHGQDLRRGHLTKVVRIRKLVREVR